MKLFTIYSLLFFFSITLFAVEEPWAKTIVNEHGEEGYQITFTIPERITASFSDGTKQKSYFVPMESTVRETAKSIACDLKLGNECLPGPFILIDGDQLDDFPWSSVIAAKNSLSEDRKSHCVRYVPTFEVVLHRFWF